MKNKLNTLLKQVKSSLNSLGYLNSVIVYDKDRVYCQVSKREESGDVSVYVMNSHNSYLPNDLYTYRQVAINLIKEGYEIKMQYPCNISVTKKIE